MATEPMHVRATSPLALALALAGCLTPLDPDAEDSDGLATASASAGESADPTSAGSDPSTTASSSASATTDATHADDDTSPTGDDDTQGDDTTPSDLPPVQPGGYYIVGNTVYGPDDQPHVFRGVARPSLEWNPAGESLSGGDYDLMASWGANVVRIALNQGFWLSGSSVHDPSYAAIIDQQIAWAEDAGLDVILDLHWSDRGDFGHTPEQQRMADANSVTFWTEVATRYGDDPKVLFELYNEPHDVSWSVWRDGGSSGEGWDAVGMQTLYDTVRATGTDNLVIIGGLDWAYDLSGLPGNEIDGYNIMYATHPYDYANKQPEHWQADWAYLVDDHALIASEFGSFDCDASYTTALVDFATEHDMSWTAWAWYPGGCEFPALIEDWNGTPSASGAIVRDALQAQ